MEDKKVLLSVKDLDVKFHVRGRTLTAIRGISLDIYENESIAIVGESAAGKSVFTKTFSGMLDDNGHIENGSVIFNDPELSDTWVAYGKKEQAAVKKIADKLDRYAKKENGSDICRRMLDLKSECKSRESLTQEEQDEYEQKVEELKVQRTEIYNRRQTMDAAKDKKTYTDLKHQLDQLDKELEQAEAKRNAYIKERTRAAKQDKAYIAAYNKKMVELKAKYQEACNHEISKEVHERNQLIAKEIYLSVGRFSTVKRSKAIRKLLKAMEKAMAMGVDLNNEVQRNHVFDQVAFRVCYIEEKEGKLHGNAVVDLAKLKYSKDWCQVRGNRIATVFQDPMTSLNPIITIGKQISTIIMKHQHCSESEARMRAIQMMKKVGIPHAEERYDDYPFQYSGGMRQRIVIAIALSCQPKILVCDEPTTALDVTIQAQILKLIKDLQKEFHYTIIFITHDLGVVASIADRVAVLYAGQIVEVGTVEEIFYDPRHPYTWALLSSLPQLAQRNSELFSIAGTPPSLYNKITGDPFAPRNHYCMKIDTLKAPPMFRITDTHYAKTWLLDPRAPKVEKPEAIQNLHEKMIQAFRI